MRRFVLCFLFAFAIAAPARSQVGTSPRLSPVAVEQVTLIGAESAEVVPRDKGVWVLLVGPDGSVQHGVMLTVDDDVAWVEVHEIARPFPPQVITPEDGRVLIAGTPGAKYWVSLRRANAPPEWIEVEIEAGGPSPGPDPDPAPPGDYADLTQLAGELADKLGDAETRRRIKSAIADEVKAIDLELRAGIGPSLDIAKRRVVEKINAVPKRIDVDWYNGWRVPISEAINRHAPKTVAEYLDIMRAVAKGL